MIFFTYHVKRFNSNYQEAILKIRKNYSTYTHIIRPILFDSVKEREG
jgi:hypothetical protein